jgi:hypothetical protein
MSKLSQLTGTITQPSTKVETAKPQSDWRNEPATCNQILGKKDFKTGKRSGGINRMVNYTKDLTNFPAGELEDVLMSVHDGEKFTFILDTEGDWSCSQLTKGEAADMMEILYKLPNRGKAIAGNGEVTTTTTKPKKTPAEKAAKKAAKAAKKAAAENDRIVVDPETGKRYVWKDTARGRRLVLA